jgi:hypothetical protein
MHDLRPLLAMILCAWVMILGLVTIVLLVVRNG